MRHNFHKELRKNIKLSFQLVLKCEMLHTQCAFQKSTLCKIDQNLPFHRGHLMQMGHFTNKALSCASLDIYSNFIPYNSLTLMLWSINWNPPAMPFNGVLPFRSGRHGTAYWKVHNWNKAYIFKRPAKFFFCVINRRYKIFLFLWKVSLFGSFYLDHTHNSNRYCNDNAT